MRYQLVLQWPSDSSVQDYDTLIETEDLLMEKLTGKSEVDGHDSGSGQMNIFILTDDPLGSFEQVRAILQGRKNWATTRIAYREVEDDKYTVIWPKQLTNFEVG